jgi:hypothetical protein
MMKLFLSYLFVLFSSYSFSQELSYYLPQDVSYDPSVPTPEEVIGHHVGEWHVTHDRLVNYMKAIAQAAPSKVKLQVTGYTYEARPQLLLIFTSPRNHQRLEEIRSQHVQLSDATKSAALNIEHMPAVVYIGHSIHGNESSGANASLLSAYYLAAARGNAVDDLLENVVILFDPSFNPDGLNRFATWANQHKSKTPVTDPNSREFNEVWPGGRFNHYWFDLNRDWLPAQHIESQNRLKVYHHWKPNILTDHHEMGSNSSFFFQPGVPSRVNPLTPTKNQELTAKIAKYHTAYLDKIGSLYYSGEGYDDFYYGKGSTYPDVNGAIGILFEQASSRGHAQQTVNGILKFEFTIRNQFTTTLSTLEAARNLRKELLAFQRDFYKSVSTESGAAPVKAYVFGDRTDKEKTRQFLNMLLRHQVNVYELNTDIQETAFDRRSSFIVPAAQPQYRLIRAIFDKTLNYKDSLFYDVTAWTMPLAFGLPYQEIAAANFYPHLIGKKVDSSRSTSGGGMLGGKSEYAYLFEWDEYLAPKALYELQQAGITARVATSKFNIEIGGGRIGFDYGTITIPVTQQQVDADKLFNLMLNAALKNGLTVYSLQSGSSSNGGDLGSNKHVSLVKPSVMMLAGAGVSATDAGEVWHLLDQRFNIPLSILESSVFNRADISKYNTIIMVSGSYPELNKEKLKSWVQAGGNLLVFEDAVQWAAQQGFASITFKKPQGGDSTRSIPYAEKEFRDGAQQLTGAIFKADLDRTHPLGYGFKVPYVYLFKANKVFPEKNKNPYATPATYGSQPLVSGYLTKENRESSRNAAAVLVNALGNGKVISIVDNPNFRAFWLGGTKLMMNAIFFAPVINNTSAR